MHGGLCGLLFLFLAVTGRAEARILLRLSCCLVGWELICPEKAIGAPKESEYLGGRTSFFSSHQAKVMEIELAGFVVLHTAFP